MNIKIIICLALTSIFAVSTVIAESAEPTWLLTVPKAECLKKGNYNIGFPYFDFGIADNLEIGLHGIKYSISDDLAIGASPFLLSPYLVFSMDAGSGNLHLGFKTAPYVFFAGLEAPVSDKVKLLAEFSNIFSAGVRLYPARNWTLDIYAILVSAEIYKYKYQSFEIEQFHAVPLISFAYSGRF